MPIEEKKQSGEALPMPNPGNVLTFVGPDGTPSIKDEAGVITPSATLDGSPAQLNESAAPVPVANAVTLYAKDLGGATVLYYIDDSGVEVILAGRGQTMLPLWKGGTPGDSFVDTDTVNPSFGDRVMFTIPTGDSITINLPAISAANAGQRVGLYDTTFAAKAIGDINLVPSAGDSLGGHPASATRKLAVGQQAPWLELESDGNDTWSVVTGNLTCAPFDAFVP